MDYLYKTQPFSQQAEAFELSRDYLDFALLMEMGTGKSKVLIDTSAWLYACHKIRMHIVVAPNGVHANWVNKELPTHLPDWTNPRNLLWTSDLEKTKKGQRLLDHVVWDTEHTGLRTVAMNMEAFSQNGKTCRARALVERICNAMPTMLSIDESTRIKSPGALCTKNMLYLGKRARYRRIATGLPVTKSPLDLFSQLLFLGEQYLGYDNYWVFKHQYAEWKKEHDWKRDHDYETLVGYKNLEELVRNLQAVSYRKTKRECLDLPPKMYARRVVRLSAAQAEWYERLRKAMVVELATTKMTITMQLTRMLRLQQVLGGFVVDDDKNVHSIFERHSANPRIQELLAVIEETQGKVIVWARFKPEIDAIVTSLTAVYGAGSVVQYHGDTPKDARAEAVARFQGERAVAAEDGSITLHAVPEAEQARFFVGNQECAGIGLTLTACDTMVYYSNTFNLEDRLQSEDRAHRIGLTHGVTYVDLEAENTIDTDVIENLLAKFDIAKLITSDHSAQWLARRP